ncbi:hypothetical protein HMPREF1604_04151, partial [Escherichia coli 908519]
QKFDLFNKASSDVKIPDAMLAHLIRSTKAKKNLPSLAGFL